MANEQNLTPFKKGDPRINRKGRPRTFDAARTLAQEIAHEVALSDGKPLIIDGHKVTVIEAILRKWATSKDARLQMAFVEYAYGKPPQRNDVVNIDVSKLTDEQLDRLAKGEDVHAILAAPGES